MVRSVPILIFLGLPFPVGNIGFASQDGLDSPPGGFDMKLLGPKHIAMIGNGHSMHSVVDRFL